MIIQTINLSKKFKDKLAVNNLNIHVNENEIYAATHAWYVFTVA